MTKKITGLIARAVQAINYKGAAAYLLNKSDPLKHLVFTKGSAFFTDTFYRSRQEELFAYSEALLAAEAFEPGFGWKFAAYMRDPKNGKGNRIQGTVAAAILASADPNGTFTEEYTYKCLKHRADDLIIFLTHFHNLHLGDVPEAARRGMARAANGMDEYQLLKYAGKQYPISRLRIAGKRKKYASLRIVDALGLAKAYLNERTLAIYNYLHAPSRLKDKYAQALDLAPHRRKFFQGGNYADAEAGRVTLEQILSARGSGTLVWHNLFDMENVLPDTAFKNHIRCMYKAGVNINRINLEARSRKYIGIYPHQVFAGYAAVKRGTIRYKDKAHQGKSQRKLKQVAFQAYSYQELTPIFETVLRKTMKAASLDGLSLGLADISPSMFTVNLAGDLSTMKAGDAAILFSSLMAETLGFAGTFGDGIQIIDHTKETVLEFADEIKTRGRGWGGTQVTRAVIDLIAILLNQPERPRPTTIYFFSDMQFDPPEIETLPPKPLFRTNIRDFFSPHKPPLESAIAAYRSLIGEVDIVLWNLSSYDTTPVSTKVDGVFMTSGFDVNTFKHIAKWKAEQRQGRLAEPVLADRQKPLDTPEAGELDKIELPDQDETCKVRPGQEEIEYIRGF
ncbi:MAG TPA: hypothetical protein PKE54_18230 [Candidatus Obscuribacter sp.]|nr:hypothetical protein [Candidatus Obscuribacter sp.]